MAKKVGSLPLDLWAVVIGATTEQVKTAWEDLQRRGLAAMKGGNREEIERESRRSREIYAAHAPKQESIPT